MRAPSRSTPPEIPHCLGEGSRPEVLPQQQRGRVPGLEFRGDEFDVLRTDEAAELTGEVVESFASIQLVDLEGEHISVVVLADEDEVEYPHRPRLDERNQLRGDLTGELVPGEPHHDVFNWPNGHIPLLISMVCDTVTCTELVA